MSNGLRMLRWGTTIAVCVGSLSFAGVQAQQYERKDTQPFQQQDLQQLWDQQKAQMRERINAAVQQLRTACAQEVSSIELIEADLGSPLGLGTRGVLISPGDLRWKGDHVELQMGADQVRSILQGHQPRR